MNKGTLLHTVVLTIIALIGIIAMATAQAEPGDAQAVAKARRDYADAMKGHDKGLQNAMKTELTFQLTKEKERKATASKHPHATVAPKPQAAETQTPETQPDNTHSI